MKPNVLLIVASILVAVGHILMGMVVLMMVRNKKVCAWRLRANQSWSSKAELVSDMLRHNTYMWAHFPPDFMWILEQNRNFYKIHNTLPSYQEMLKNLRMWNYEQATGDYETQLELNFQTIIDRVHEVEDKFELLKQAQS